MSINNITVFTKGRSPIKMLTCYDYWTARILANSDIDAVLVGDSVAMVMHGHLNTVHADVEMIALHTKAVRSGIGQKFIVADIPFLSHRKSLDTAVYTVEKLMRAGANAVKLEGIDGNETLIKHLVQSGVPVMGHLGLMPQHVNLIGGTHAQCRTNEEAGVLLKNAKELENLGCFSIVLECIPAEIAKHVTDSLSIPTIGIGAGPDTSGQILVLQDMLGMNQEFAPKFLKKYINGAELIQNAIEEFCKEVNSGIYPDASHTYAFHKPTIGSCNQ
ncbi:3-methyl-2-oxobutanoate hydroxymethyltransferase [Rickettsiales endosymbiont of Peranema trichophorum]|uniref:3-methyl-2-oxobutanoate hydroxymethyltransferase n=1 Tax=Rickettsiales endosymbiont of Peranema trichophorum TaxID=2486577 RepID=UPI001023F278|nr:3-methyl-2-oxobutanoate hydroxymethyltransferase [Rickettsiales endosymbiont of Peranema trichophorum]RZI47730.1 3-methyl-2-oxobutanoate hydroxymethyltransferase [Rickettsiales endosymbiont of Peranema trichophorum]